MKKVMLFLMVLISYASHSFYCADGNAEFRVKFYDLDGHQPNLEDMYDGMELVGDTSLSTMDFPKRFQAIVFDRGDYLVIEDYDGPEVLSIEVSKNPGGTLRVGGSWHDPNSGSIINIFPVLNASYNTMTTDQYVHLEDLYNGSMDCWTDTGGPTLESSF